MYPRTIARLLRLNPPLASPRVAAPAPATVSDSLSYDAWLRDDWVRTGRPDTEAGPAEEPHGPR